MALFQLVYNQFCTFSCLTHICMAVIGIREPRAMGHLVKTMVFPVVRYGCESWTIKKAEHWRTDAFELWCWRRLLRVPWTARRSNPSILKEINPEYSLEALMLKLKLQYFGQLMWKTDSLEKTLMLWKIEGRRRKQQQKMRVLDGITYLMTWVWASSGRWWRSGKPDVLHVVPEVTEILT